MFLDVHGITSIKRAIRNTNSYIGMMFAEGVVYAKVKRREILEFNPVKVTDETGTVLTVGVQTNSTEILLKDPRDATKSLIGGTSLPATVNGDAQILHGAIGLAPATMQYYIRYPAKSGSLYGVFPQINAPRFNQLDRMAKVDGYDSPYREPTNMVELVLVPDIDFSLVFANNNPSNITGVTTDADEPQLNVFFGRYILDVLRPAQDINEIPAERKARMRAKRDNEIIRNCVYGKYDEKGLFKYLPVGFGDQLIPYPEDLATKWKVRPITDDNALGLPEVFV
nr:hypothetical protein [uncultured Nitrososphaera sp.]